MRGLHCFFSRHLSHAHPPVLSLVSLVSRVLTQRSLSPVRCSRARSRSFSPHTLSLVAREHRRVPLFDMFDSVLWLACLGV